MGNKAGADHILQATQGVGILSYTVNNLPQVLIDGMTIGFVYEWRKGALEWD